MNSLEKILTSPWNFTLYKTSEGKFILKVMFIEGDYKIDIPRYFTLKAEDIGDIDKMRKISDEIRNGYESYKNTKISKVYFNSLSDSKSKL